MRSVVSIRFKAIFLTIVFLMNTAIGFACSIGINTEFSKSHHQQQTDVAVRAHSHPPGTKPHSHDEPAKAEKKIDHQDKKDNCCKNEVAKFISLDKHIVKNTVVKIPIVLHQAMPVFEQDIFVIGIHTTDKRYFVRCHHPPIPDIRIALQSFQI